MTGQEIREQAQKNLSKQLELLTEASRKCDPKDLDRLTAAMVLVVKELRDC